jgi:hypothetical protein
MGGACDWAIRVGRMHLWGSCDMCNATSNQMNGDVRQAGMRLISLAQPGAMGPDLMVVGGSCMPQVL